MIKLCLGLIVFCISLCLIGQDGNLDNSFNGNGLVVTGSSNGVNDNGWAVLVQDDEKIILAGSSDGRIGVIRYNDDGSLDDTFGSNGIVLTTYGNDDIYGIGAAIQDDQRIIVGGAVNISSEWDYSVAKYNPDGSLDLTFGNDGIAIAYRDGDDLSRAFCLQTDGKILVGGYSVFIDPWPSFEFSIQRFNPDGSVDSSFGTDGLAHINKQGHLNELWSIAVQEDGKIVAAGETYDQNGDNADFVLIRFNTNGIPDTSFNSTGMVLTDFNNGSHDYATSVAIQSDDKIVVGGYSSSNSDEDLAIARYNPDGSLDLTFNQDGKLTTDLGSFWDNGRAITIQPDGKIVLAGIADSPTDVDYILARYNPDGEIDNSFGINGVVWTDFGIGDDKTRAVCLDQEGRILAAGYSGNLPSGDYDYSLARYLNELSIGIVDFENDNILALVYPNPIKNKATLQYELKNDESIGLDLYDIQGNLIKSFITNKYRVKGKHVEQLHFDNSIPSGNYILVLNNGNHLKSIRIYKQ